MEGGGRGGRGGGKKRKAEGMGIWWGTLRSS